MIRKAKQTELSSVMQIWLDGNIEGRPFIPIEYWQKNAETIRQILMTADIYVYETEEDHKVVGVIGLTDHFIQGLFVHRNYRNAGVGKELLNYVKLHLPYLVLHVYQKNKTGQDFYLQEGFSITKEQVDKNTNETEYEMIWEK